MSEEEKSLDLEELAPEAGDSTSQESPSVPDVAAQTAPPVAIEGEETKVASDLEPVFDVPVNISAVLGKTQLNVNELLKLAPGSVLELDRKVGEAIDILVNRRLVARGEVVVVDERLGVTMTEIIKADDRS